MEKLTKKKVKDLDDILNKLVKSDGNISINDFQNNKGEYFGFKKSEEGENYFKDLLALFDKLNIANIDIINLEISPINSKHRIFKSNGGFKGYCKKKEVDEKRKIKFLDKEKERQEFEDKIQKLTFDNLEYSESIRIKEEKIRDLTEDNLKLNNWDIKFRWIIVIITFLIGFFTKYVISLV